jgi:hypothetical protein
MSRAWKANQIVYCLPEAKLWPKVSSLTGTASSFAIRYGARNRALFIAKHVPGFYGAVFQWMYAFYYLLRFLLRKDSRADYDIKRAAWEERRRIPV